MTSIEEDDDLEALRLAALSTIKSRKVNDDEASEYSEYSEYVTDEEAEVKNDAERKRRALAKKNPKKTADEDAEDDVLNLNAVEEIDEFSCLLEEMEEEMKPKPKKRIVKRRKKIKKKATPPPAEDGAKQSRPPHYSHHQRSYTSMHPAHKVAIHPPLFDRPPPSIPPPNLPYPPPVLGYGSPYSTSRHDSPHYYRSSRSPPRYRTSPPPPIDPFRRWSPPDRNHRRISYSPPPHYKSRRGSDSPPSRPRRSRSPRYDERSQSPYSKSRRYDEKRGRRSASREDDRRRGESAPRKNDNKRLEDKSTLRVKSDVEKSRSLPPTIDKKDKEKISRDEKDDEKLKEKLKKLPKEEREKILARRERFKTTLTLAENKKISLKKRIEAPKTEAKNRDIGDLRQRLRLKQQEEEESPKNSSEEDERIVHSGRQATMTEKHRSPTKRKSVMDRLGEPVHNVATKSRKVVSGSEGEAESPSKRKIVNSLSELKSKSKVKKSKKDKKEKRKKKKKRSKKEESEEDEEEEEEEEAEPPAAVGVFDPEEEELLSFFEKPQKDEDDIMDKMREKNEARLKRMREIEDDRRVNA